MPIKALYLARALIITNSNKHSRHVYWGAVTGTHCCWALSMYHPLSLQWGRYYCLHFIDKKTTAHRSLVAWPRKTILITAGLLLNLCLADSKARSFFFSSIMRLLVNMLNASKTLIMLLVHDFMLSPSAERDTFLVVIKHSRWNPREAGG